eukprot:m.295300 g.295300  ORF g.295300 m.295300 type:complete len:244 (-) comp13160_c0_seq1:189-920(-)
MEGWIHFMPKEGVITSVTNSIRRRKSQAAKHWFSLKGNALTWSSEERGAPAGTINLDHCTDVVVNKEDNKISLHMEDLDCTVYVLHLNAADPSFDKWGSVLNAVVPDHRSQLAAHEPQRMGDQCGWVLRHHSIAAVGALTKLTATLRRKKVQPPEPQRLWFVIEGEHMALYDKPNGDCVGLYSKDNVESVDAPDGQHEILVTRKTGETLTLEPIENYIDNDTDKSSVRRKFVAAVLATIAAKQ